MCGPQLKSSLGHLISRRRLQVSAHLVPDRGEHLLRPACATRGDLLSYYWYKLILGLSLAVLLPVTCLFGFGLIWRR